MKKEKAILGKSIRPETAALDQEVTVNQLQDEITILNKRIDAILEELDRIPVPGVLTWQDLGSAEQVV